MSPIDRRPREPELVLSGPMPRTLTIHTPEEVGGMDAAQALGILRKAPDTDAALLLERVAAYRRCVELGEREAALAALRPYRRLYKYVPRMAEGTLAVGVVAKWGGVDGVMKRVERLLPSEQERLARDERVPVVEKGSPDGPEFDVRMLTISEMGTVLLEQVVGPDGRIRTPAEQEAYLRAVPKAVPWKPADTVEEDGWVIDPVSRTVRFGRGKPGPLDSLVKALKKARVRDL